MSDEYGALGRERLLVLLLRTAHLSPEQRQAAVQWANCVLIDNGILENVLAGYAEIGDVVDGHVSVRLTEEGRAALREADALRNVGRKG